MAKATQTLGNVYSGLDPRIKIGVQVIGLALTGYLIWKLIRKTNQSTADKPNVSENQQTANELQMLNQNPATKQKISNSQAISMANSIYQAMAGLGTDEDAIISQFYYLRNDADYLALQKAFGTRTIPSGTIVFVSDFRGTLAPALRNELSASDCNKINKILILKKIKYRV
jgi:hypothetical protein